MGLYHFLFDSNFMHMFLCSMSITTMLIFFVVPCFLFSPVFFFLGAAIPPGFPGSSFYTSRTHTHGEVSLFWAAWGVLRRDLDTTGLFPPLIFGDWWDWSPLFSSFPSAVFFQLRAWHHHAGATAYTCPPFWVSHRQRWACPPSGVALASGHHRACAIGCLPQIAAPSGSWGRRFRCHCVCTIICLLHLSHGCVADMPTRLRIGSRCHN